MDLPIRFWLYDNPDIEGMDLEELLSAVRSNSFYEPRQGFTTLDKQHLKQYIHHRVFLSFIPIIATVGVASVVMEEVTKLLKKVKP